MKEKLNALLVHIATAEIVFESEASWESKFALIFAHQKENIRPLVAEVGLTLEWYDPDTSYEEDVRAYMAALAQLRDEVKRVVAGFEADDDINVTVTVKTMQDKGVWNEFCNLRGINVWAVNEGMMDKTEWFTLSAKEARQLGFLS